MKITGYIVERRGRRAVGLADNNILYFTGYVTEFPTYEQARNAIRRTNNYGKRKGYRWETLGELRIVPIKQRLSNRTNS